MFRVADRVVGDETCDYDGRAVACWVRNPDSDDAGGRPSAGLAPGGKGWTRGTDGAEARIQRMKGGQDGQKGGLRAIRSWRD